MEFDAQFVAKVSGYTYSILIGHILVGLNVDALRKNKDLSVGFRVGWHARFLGVLERALYTATYHAGHTSFIAIWLGLKAISQWKLWYEGTENEKNGTKVEGRSIFNIFLIGNALSVCFGLLGERIMTWVACGDISKAVFLGGLFIFATICTCVITYAIGKWEDIKTKAKRFLGFLKALLISTGRS